MYAEELAINHYETNWSNWNSLPDEEKWEHEEPEPPVFLLARQIAEEEEIVAPDVMGELGMS